METMDKETEVGVVEYFFGGLQIEICPFHKCVERARVKLRRNPLKSEGRGEISLVLVLDQNRCLGCIDYSSDSLY